jgi:hypothetical protein
VHRFSPLPRAASHCTGRSVPRKKAAAGIRVPVGLLPTPRTQARGPGLGHSLLLILIPLLPSFRLHADETEAFESNHAIPSLSLGAGSPSPIPVFSLRPLPSLLRGGLVAADEGAVGGEGRGNGGLDNGVDRRGRLVAQRERVAAVAGPHLPHARRALRRHLRHSARKPRPSFPDRRA